MNLIYKVSFLNKEEVLYINDREVDPNTVGQYVGLEDDNGHCIFEDDLLYINEDMPCVLVKWSYRDYGFALFCYGDDICDGCYGSLSCFDGYPARIIGNIHDKDIQEKIQNIKIWSEK